MPLDIEKNGPGAEIPKHPVFCNIYDKILIFEWTLPGAVTILIESSDHN